MMDYFTKIRRLVGNEPIILSGAVGAVVKDGKILLVRRHNLSRTWGIPGGVQELGETIRETAHREVLEEVGLNLQASDLIGVYSSSQWDIEFPDSGRIQQLALFFLMEGKIGEITIQESEVADWGFFTPQEMPENIMPCCRQKVLDWASYQGKTIFR
ncbi:MAG: NUDIX domain-containing protein [Chloroflexi bacterium]|nr:NUDIX domain-containing protein [Chloroflexota bacterium]